MIIATGGTEHGRMIPFNPVFYAAGFET